MAAPDDYEAHFVTTPDPWSAISRLEYGGDRTLVAGIEDAVRNADAAQAAELERRLLAVLQSAECSAAGRLFVVRQLALVGSAATAAALGPWLLDTARVELARYALEAIPEPSIDAAYREAVLRMPDSVRLGLIGGMVARGDRGAVPALRSLVERGAVAAEVRAAAERAIAVLTSPQPASS